MLTDSEKAIFSRLDYALGTCQAQMARLDAYYEGEQRLEQLGIAVPPELQDFVTIVNWPRTAVDSVEQRVDLQGFRLAGQDKADDDLWRIWQESGLDEESQLAHLDTLIFGRQYVCVGSNAERPESPRITVESPQEMTAEYDPKSRAVTAALRRYSAPFPRLGDFATLYLANATVWLERNTASKWQWVETERDEHMLGVVPVVPLVNRSRVRRRYGVSEMKDVISLTDAACRALTNAQLATEAAAIPQKYVLGAVPADFVDPKTGENLTVWETYFGSVWALMNPNAKMGQFDAAQLSNFSGIVDHYAGLVAGETGLPMRYFGQNTANPPSADGIRADESRLITNARRKMRTWGGTWEQVMRIARRIVDKEWDPSLMRMETLWANPETPTVAQQADATMKLATTLVNGVPVLPLRMARERIGMSAGDILRAEQLDREAPLVVAATVPEPLPT